MTTRLAALLSLCCVTGCTELSVRRLPTPSDPPVPALAVEQRGLGYSLPFVQFEITVTRQLKSCDKGGPDVSVDVAAVPSSLPDPAHSYVIDPGSLSNWFKTSEIAVTFHPSGGVKTLGLTAEDHFGPALVSIATSAAQVAGLVSSFGGTALLRAVPGGGASRSAAPPRTMVRSIEPCSAAALAALGEVKRLKPKAVQAAAALALATARLMG